MKSDSDVYISVISQQRNAALDAVAHLAAQLELARVRIMELEKAQGGGSGARNDA